MTPESSSPEQSDWQASSESSAWLHERPQQTAPVETPEQAAERAVEATSSAAELKRQAGELEAQAGAVRDRLAAVARGSLDNLSPSERQEWSDMEATEAKAADLKVKAADIEANNAR